MAQEPVPWVSGSSHPCSIQPASRPIRLYLIRHGESEANILAREVITGRSSSSRLTESGIEQAHKLGKFMGKNVPLDQLYCSAAVRAKQTVEIIFTYNPHLNVSQLIPAEALEERDTGDFVGQKREEVWNPDRMMEASYINPWHFSPPNGESIYQVEGNLF
jgi:broad specificity phosphatase PhoE